MESKHWIRHVLIFSPDSGRIVGNLLRFGSGSRAKAISTQSRPCILTLFVWTPFPAALCFVFRVTMRNFFVFGWAPLTACIWDLWSGERLNALFLASLVKNDQLGANISLRVQLFCLDAPPMDIPCVECFPKNFVCHRSDPSLEMFWYRGSLIVLYTFGSGL